jgi:hypothetical protein
LLRVLERERAAFALERRMLLDTICRLAGHPASPSEMDMWKHQQSEQASRVAADEADDLVDYDQLPYEHD